MRSTMYMSVYVKYKLHQNTTPEHVSHLLEILKNT